MLLVNNKLSLLNQSVEAHNVERTLKKGFVLVKQDSKYITRAKKIKKESPASLIFYDDKIDVKLK
jgi:exonuclease VII large subunit